MVQTTVSEKRAALAPLDGILLAPGVILAALCIRLYQFQSPLWLDELYGYRLARIGLQATIQNSWTDAHPPLYYLIQWAILTTWGFDSSLLRWLPVLCGTALIVVVWTVSRAVGSRLACGLTCLIAATAPSLVFYSQEARPFALLMLLAALSMWLVSVMLNQRPASKLWFTWATVNVLGLSTGYAFLMVFAMQAVYLGCRYYRRPAWWVALSAIGVCLLCLLPFAVSSLTLVAGVHANAQPLHLLRAVMPLLASEPARYGWSVSHFVIPAVTALLSLVAVLRAIRLHSSVLAYFAIQAVVPLAGFFAFSPLLGIRLPPAEAKQFLVLVPAFLVLMAAGLSELEFLTAQVGSWQRLLVPGLVLIVLALNGRGLWTYWRTPKSNEAVAILQLRERLQPADPVVSPNYALTFAAAYYLPGAQLYVHPQPLGDAFSFIATSANDFWLITSRIGPEVSTSTIRSTGRFWLVTRGTAYQDVEAALTRGCNLDERTRLGEGTDAIWFARVRCPPTAQVEPKPETR